MDAAWTVPIGAVVSALIGMLGYFVKRLVDEVKNTSCIAQKALNGVLLVEEKADRNHTALKEAQVDFHDMLDGVRAELKEARRVEIDVAVMKAWFAGLHEKGKRG